MTPPDIQVADVAVINPLPSTIGFADGADFLTLSAADMNRNMDMMVATGAHTLRILIPWAMVEPAQGQRNWSISDTVVNFAVAHNMSILGVISTTPPWAQAPGGSGLSGKPASPAVFGDFAKAAAQHYSGRISAYEIWNEPNGTLSYTQSPDPAGYTNLLKAAYPKIKSVSSTITVIGGALGSVIESGITGDPVAFVTQMYSAGAKNYFDALSIHPYQYTTPFSRGVRVDNSPLQQLMKIRQLMLANNDGGKKIWATEYGQPTAASNDITQNRYIVDFVKKWQEMPYTGPIMIYRTRDISTGSPEPDATLGVFRSDYTPKPSQQSLQWLIANGIPKTPEFQQFAGVNAAANGTALSPVYLADPSTWARRFTVNTVYQTPTGFIASPDPVADRVQPAGLIPQTEFKSGYQDFTDKARVYYSPATGAHLVGSGVAAAWVPALGLATTDENAIPTGGVYVNFEHGRISWTP